jgi:hypothetical protein
MAFIGGSLLAGGSQKKELLPICLLFSINTKWRSLVDHEVRRPRLKWRWTLIAANCGFSAGAVEPSTLGPYKISCSDWDPFGRFRCNLAPSGRVPNRSELKLILPTGSRPR